MKRKIIEIFIVTLLIATAVLPVVETMNIEKNQDIKTSYEPNDLLKPSRRSSNLPLLPPFLLELFNGDWDYWSNSPNIFAIPDGNIGIGTSNPTSKLEVVGNVEADGFTINGVPIGTSTDSYWSEGEDEIYYDGNVGIGTTNPNAALQVNGAISRQGTFLSGAYAHTQVNLGVNSSTDYWYSTVSGGEHNEASRAQSTVSGGCWNNASGQWSTVSGGSSNEASGRWSTVSGGRENIAGGDYSWAGGKFMRLTDTAHRTFVWGSSDYYESIDTPDAFLIFPAGNPGNVGIGTMNPSIKLEVAGEIQASQNIFFQEDNDAVIGFNYPDSTRDNRLRITAGKEDLVQNSQGACIDLHGNDRPQDTALGGELHLVAGSAGGPILFYTGAPTEKMRITGDGNVGIGTANPTSELHVIGKGTFTGGIDPPYISFSEETHESIRQYAQEVEDHEKVMQFWNGEAHRMEMYVISEDTFYTITGELIE
jgi:hypothetical protein